MESFAARLAELDDGALAALLARRADVLVEPVPQGFEQLAQRLSAPGSLAAALREIDRDTLVIAETAAALGPVRVESLASLPGMPEANVGAAVDELCARGLAWLDAELLRLPDRLADHFTAAIGNGKPFRTIANATRVDDLRAGATALGLPIDGLRKPELVDAMADLFADFPRMVALLGGLPEQLREQVIYGLPAFGGFAPSAPDRELAELGLALPNGYRLEVPNEVAFAAWLAEREPLTGRPSIPAANAGAPEVRAQAAAAAQELVRAVTALLDAARGKPLAALKKGGVGSRERSRLANRLALSGETVSLGIDLAHEGGLLALTEAGYAPTPEYEHWRGESTGKRWAALATTWMALEHAPTHRELDEGKEHPPPLPLSSGAGLVRSALLCAAREGGSVTATGERIDWFCPLHGYEPEQLAAKVTAAVREAELLGAVADDVITELGTHLLGGEAEPGTQVEALLPDYACSVSVQSDLTVVVSGQPSTRLMRLLETAAETETRGTASVWRFSPASIRNALDAGWTADEVTGELEALSGQLVPQPLEYLITDAARKHGRIRVRGVRACVLADEALATELLHTRALNKLRLAQLAPTVLASPEPPETVAERLRGAGFSPAVEDETGSVVVARSQEHEAETRGSVEPRRRVGPEQLAEALRADPYGAAAGGDSETNVRLAELNPSLDDAARGLLADALDQQRNVVIAYRDKNGTHTVRAIQPVELYGRWLTSWCHLRDGERDFTVANIEAVGPVS